jgi:hypothetical protein
MNTMYQMTGSSAGTTNFYDTRQKRGFGLPSRVHFNGDDQTAADGLEHAGYRYASR